MKFKAIDYNLSPYTGLTRESWIEAGAYLLSGIFQDVESVQNPIVVKRTETEITYPHKTADEEVIKLEKMAERFEGLARSFFIAAPLSITLGSYGFPDNGTEIIKMTCDGAKAVVLRGKDKTGVEKQLAMTIYDGWDDIDVVHSEGTNPDSEKSIVIYGKAKREKAYDGKQKAVFISQVITKEDAEPFTEEEIFPIENICYSDKYRTGRFGNIEIKLADGTARIIRHK